MRKRGALFYIIDAFVASAIIALTLTIIFATQISEPESEQAKDVLNNYYQFLKETPLEEAPGTTSDTLILSNRIATGQSILEAIIELHATTRGKHERKPTCTKKKHTPKKNQDQLPSKTDRSQEAV
jgi:hypothetical protein